jgi:hypothetical protein
LYTPLSYANLTLEQNNSFYLALVLAGETHERGAVQSDSESERYSLCSDRTVLRCRRCRESLILLGCEEDWYSEGRTTFECHQCGGEISLPNNLDGGQGPDLIDNPPVGGFDEENISVRGVRDLIRNLKASGQ